MFFRNRSHTRGIRAASVLVLLASLSACACPPCSGSGAHTTGGRDPAATSFAFFGGLKAFFGDTSPSCETRGLSDEDLTCCPNESAGAEASR